MMFAYPLAMRAFLLASLVLSLACGDDGLAVEGQVIAVADGLETSFDFAQRVALLDETDPSAGELFSGSCRRVARGEGEAWRFSIARPGAAPEGLGLARISVDVVPGSGASLAATLGQDEYVGATGANCVVTASEWEDHEEEDDDLEFDDDMRLSLDCDLAGPAGEAASVSGELFFTGCSG